MKFKEKDIKKMGIALVVGIVIGLIAGVSINKAIYIFKNKETISIDYLTGKLKDVGELATQEVTYTSRVQIEKGSIPFITKKGFTMEYNATLKAGIKMDDLNIITKGEKFIISVPHAEFLEPPHVDPNSIKFIDEKKAVLNWNNKDDVAEAIAEAEKDVDENPTIDTTDLLDRADDNFEKIVHNLLDDSVGEEHIEIVFK